MLSAHPKRIDATEQEEDGIDPIEPREHFIRQGRFTAGTGTHYGLSLITADSSYQSLAKGFPIGMRFHSAPVIRLPDAKPMHLGHTVRADGRWRLFAFADAERPTNQASPLRALCEFLDGSSESPLWQYTPAGEDIDAVFEVIAICQQSCRDLSVQGMPKMLLPSKGRCGLIDYEKIYCPVLNRDIFDSREIDRRQGCLVVVRPDQYVAHLLPLNSHNDLAAFFDRFMLRRR